MIKALGKMESGEAGGFSGTIVEIVATHTFRGHYLYITPNH